MANRQQNRPTDGAILIELLRRGTIARTWTVSRSSARLGSGEACDIRLRGVPGLRALHATLTAGEGGVTVVPVGNASVLINGVQTDFAVPRPTDVLSFGRMDVRVRWEAAPRRQPASTTNQEPPDAPILVVEAPGGRRRTLTLPPGELRIGSRSAQIRLRFPGVRAEHAALHTEGGTVTLEARDGRVVRNGLGTRRCVLKRGDVVEIGAVRLWLAAARPKTPPPMQLHVPHHLLRTDAHPLPEDEDIADPDTVLMPGAQAELFDGPPPPTVLAEAPPEAVVEDPPRFLDVEDTPTQIAPVFGDTPPGPPPRERVEEAEDPPTADTPWALRTALPPVAPAAGVLADHAAARVLRVEEGRVLTAKEVWPGRTYEDGPLHCRVVGREVLVDSRVPMRRGADVTGPGELRLADGESVRLDADGTAWRIDVYRPVLGGGRQPLRWALAMIAVVAAAWMLHGLVVA